MAKLGPYQSQSFRHWQGLTLENHLGALFQKEPQKASNTMVQLLATRRGKTLETYLNSLPSKTFDRDDEYTWDVVSSSRRNIPIVEVRDYSGTPYQANTNVTGRFYVVFPEDWFSDGAVIVGEHNERYPIRLLSDGRAEGTNFVYLAELWGSVQAIPSEEFAAGKRWSIEYYPVEKELSRGIGTLHFSAPTSMRNEWSRLRMKYKVPGSMMDEVLICGIPMIDNKTNKVVVKDRWMAMVDYRFEEEFQDHKNYCYMFGRSNRNNEGEYTNFGKSGLAIKFGAGIREQMEVSNVYYYNTFSLRLIENALYELSANKLDLNERVFVMRTGMRGAEQFSKAVLNDVSGWTAFQMNADNLGVIQRTSSPLHQTALAAGFQFTEFRAPNGIVLKVEVDPMYDEDVRNKIQHPNGGPAESYRYDILYVGSQDQPNIQLAKLKNHDEFRGYYWGPFRNPFTGEMNNGNAATDEDSATIHKMWIGGVFILDPTRTVSIIPSILQ